MKKRFFTLIEVLAVIGIIAILSIIGVAGYSYAQNSSRESDTKALLTRVAAAMESAKASGGSVVSENFATVKVYALDNKVEIGGKALTTDAAKAFIKAIEADSLSKYLNSNNELVDAWGNLIYYRYPGEFNKGGIDLVSAGADGGFGKGEASTPSTTLSDYKDGKELICDDVVNF